MLLVTLEEEPTARKPGRNNPKEKENPHITFSLSLHWQGQDSTPD